MNCPEKRVVKHSKLKMQLLLIALPAATTLRASAAEQGRKENLFSGTIKTSDQWLVPLQAWKQSVGGNKKSKQGIQQLCVLVRAIRSRQ